MRTRDLELQLAELRRCLRRAVDERHALWLELAASRAREKELQARQEQLGKDALTMGETLRDVQAKLNQVEADRCALLRELVQRDATVAQLRDAHAAQGEQLKKVSAHARELSDEVARHVRAVAESTRELERWQEHASRLDSRAREAFALANAARDKSRSLEHDLQILRAQLAAAQASLKAADAAYHRALDDLARDQAVQRQRLQAEAHYLAERARDAEAESLAARETLDNWALRLQQSRSREMVAVARAEREASARIEQAHAEADGLRDALSFVSEVMSIALRRACGRAAPVALRTALSAVRLEPLPDGVPCLRERMAERLMGLLEPSPRTDAVAGRLPAASALAPGEPNAPP